MKLLLVLVLNLILAQECEDPELRFQEMQTRIISLKTQLSVFSSDPEKIKSDLEKNKENLEQLISQFNSEGFSLAKAEEIQIVLHLISVDLNLLGSSELEHLDEVMQKLIYSIYKSKLLKENIEFSKHYNKLLLQIEVQKESIKNLENEKVSLLAELESSKLQLASLQLSLQAEERLRKNTENLLNEEKEHRINQIESLENSITETGATSRNIQEKNFKKIQDSCNALVEELQTRNSELVLKLEQGKTNYQTLENSANLEKNSCEMIKNELKVRSNQVLSCEENFEEFRRKVELENIDQIQVLKDSEKQLQKELKDLQDDRNNQIGNLNDCQKAVNELNIKNSLSENVVKGLTNDLENAQNSISSARNANEKETEILEATVEELKSALKSLQEQYDEALEKALDQSSTISSLQAKISDYEYISQRNLRG